jgi:Cu/Zn superoxide dismutase
LKAVVRGQGGGVANHGAAVCILQTHIPEQVRGLVRFVQVDEGRCSIDISVNGLPPGRHAIAIHEFGDFSKHWITCGGHFNPFGARHGDVTSQERHVGDLGNIVVNESYNSLSSLPPSRSLSLFLSFLLPPLPPPFSLFLLSSSLLDACVP